MSDYRSDCCGSIDATELYGVCSGCGDKELYAMAKAVQNERRKLEEAFDKKHYRERHNYVMEGLKSLLEDLNNMKKLKGVHG